MGFDYQGAYAQLVAIPEIALKNLFAIPEGLSDEVATFADPLSDAICGHKDIAVGLDDVVVVVGAGPVGTAHAAISRLEGARQVLLLEASGDRLELAREILGDERIAYVDVSSADGTEAVRSATDHVVRHWERMGTWARGDVRVVPEPCCLRKSPSASRRAIAARSELRETPRLRARSGSLGSRAPAGNSPASTRSRRVAAIRWRREGRAGVAAIPPTASPRSSAPRRP